MRRGDTVYGLKSVFERPLPKAERASMPGFPYRICHDTMNMKSVRMKTVRMKVLGKYLMRLRTFLAVLVLGLAGCAGDGSCGIVLARGVGRNCTREEDFRSPARPADRRLCDGAVRVVLCGRSLLLF